MRVGYVTARRAGILMFPLAEGPAVLAGYAEIVGGAPGESPDRHRAWADTVVAALDPVALPGGYPNLLGPGDDAREAFGANLGRLVTLKRRYDPDAVFSAIPALVG